MGRRIFSLRREARTPAHELQDNIDYLPTKKEILFGHHFTSIAGTGPIVGPAIAIIWGWLPALLWVVLGSIFMGAVHDFGALVLSSRHQGKSIGELSAVIVNPRVRTLLLLVIFFSLLVVLSIFCLVIATLFDLYPQSVFPIWMEIPIAIWLGHMIYRRKAKAAAMAIIAVVLMYITVVAGVYLPLEMPKLLGIEPLTTWVVILLIYAYIASVLPVWKLLQPRDYINGHELFIVLFLLVLGVLFARPQVVAPTVDLHPEGAPPILPFVFITIACGAISGFHSLVSSGTSSKQLDKETDSKLIGYGGMLLEATLATLVIIAVAAGIGKAGWTECYSEWIGEKGLGDKLRAFIEGSSNMLAAYHIPKKIALTIMGVFVASFAGTTLDTATRIQRYVISELASDYGIKGLTTRHGATLFAVITAAILTLAQGGGKGGMILWPLFGTTNQLLASIVLLVITLYLVKKGKPFIYTFIPMLFMVFMTGWAMVANLLKFSQEHNWHLVAIGGMVFILEIWMIVEIWANWVTTKERRKI